MSQTRTAPVCKPAQRGWGSLPCLKCGEEACIRLDLDTLESFTCTSCDADFTTDEVREVLARWARVLAWIDTAPTE